ncbi:MAG: hypothetical protein JJT78_13990 [Leptospira sp.]|nr:hypothetical protein [Leptospira sp.]
MKQFLFLNVLACLIMISCSESSSGNSANTEKSDKDKIPVATQAMRDGGTVTLSLQAESGFGIQIDAPNQLSAEGLFGLKVMSSDLKFKGKPRSDKPEYYSHIEPMTMQVDGKGSIQLTGKLFYCDYSKNICLPGKINRTIAIQ